MKPPTRRRRRHRFGALCAAIIAWAIAASSWAQILVVLSDGAASYQEVADELRTGLKSTRDGRLRIDVAMAGQVAGLEESKFRGYELVVTVGLAAAQAAVDRERPLATPPPTLCLLIPRLAFERLRAGRPPGRERRMSAVYIDQPLSRQLDLIRIALPQARRLGVIFGPSSVRLQDELREGARERAFTLRSADVTEASGVYGALQDLLPESDVLLAIPDPVAVSAATISGLLLASYRAQVPVIGFSESLVKAGALLGLFSTASQQGLQGAEIAQRVLASDSAMPPAQYPKYYTVRVNVTVARSLGLAVGTEASLAAALASRSSAWPAPAGRTP